MNKKGLIDAMASNKTVTKKDSNVMIQALAEVIMEALSNGDEVNLPGLGKFVVRDRAERQGRNPSNGSAITIPASKVVKFKASKGLKESVNQA